MSITTTVQVKFMPEEPTQESEATRLFDLLSKAFKSERLGHVIGTTEEWFAYFEVEIDRVEEFCAVIDWTPEFQAERCPLD